MREVKKIINEMMQSNKTPQEIATVLNERGEKTKLGKPFNSSSVYYYAGSVYYYAGGWKKKRLRDQRRAASAPTRNVVGELRDKISLIETIYSRGDLPREKRIAIIDLLLDA